MASLQPARTVREKGQDTVASGSVGVCWRLRQHADPDSALRAASEEALQTHARDEGEFFGESRLKSLAAQGTAHRPQRSADSVSEAALTFVQRTPTDDVIVRVLGYHGVSHSKTERTTRVPPWGSGETVTSSVRAIMRGIPRPRRRAVPARSAATRKTPAYSTSIVKRSGDAYDESDNVSPHSECCMAFAQASDTASLRLKTFSAERSCARACSSTNARAKRRKPISAGRCR